MKLVGAGTAAALAEKLGPPWTEPNQLRKLGKWIKGDQAPNFEGTMALLRLAGLLLEDPVSQPVLADQEILRALVDLADLQERQDELLFGLLDREVAQRRRRPARGRRQSG